MSSEFGKFFAFGAQNDGGGTQFITSDPSVVNEIFATKFMHFGDRKDFSSKTGHVFIASGDHWKQLRKRVSIFSDVKTLNPLLEAAVGSMLRTILANEGKPFDFHSTSLHLVATVLARIAFCCFVSSHHNHRHQQTFCDTYTTFAVHLLLLKENARLFRALPQAKSGEKAQQQKQQEDTNFDMFTALYKHILETEEQKKQQQAQDEKPTNAACNAEDDDSECLSFANTLGTLFLENAMKSVGIDTIGHCLALVVHFLAHRPLVQHRLRDELLRVGDGGVQTLPLLKAVIDETLRLCPIVSFASSRRCTSSASSAGVQLKSNGANLSVGDSVEADVFTMGRNRAVWGEDADQFRPERWLPGGALPVDWRRHWLPFGLGPRRCVGLPLASHLLKMAVSQIFGRFHITSADTSTEEILLIGSDVLWPEKVMVRAETIGEKNHYIIDIGKGKEEE